MAPPNRKLSRRFYLQGTEKVARSLLGCHLVHVVKGQRLVGRVVETEAYLGVDDRAAHSFGERRTERVRSMYLEGGHAYVYFIYGMHFCFNVVTRAANVPEAVLIRAVVPTEGIEQMRLNRPKAKVRDLSDLTNGPAKICQAFAIDRRCDGLDLTAESLFLEHGRKRTNEMLSASPRVGVDYAGAAAHWLLRFRLLNATS